VVIGALATVTVAAWAYLLLGAGIEMDMGGGQMMAMLPAWSPGYAVPISVMWWVMMVAMMLPTVRRCCWVTSLAWDRLDNSNLVPATALLFASGYLLVWCGFSLAATLLQCVLGQAGLLSERMAFGDAILASTVLIAVGVYQWTPLKDACLRHCRSPTEFLIRHSQSGSLGAVRTGVRHGLFCLGSAPVRLCVGS
jgi:predicted metal-binding membrane protein